MPGQEAQVVDESAASAGLSADSSAGFGAYRGADPMNAARVRLRGRLRTVASSIAAAVLAMSAVIAPVGTQLVPVANAAALTGCGLQPLDVELIIDRSGSMQSELSGGQTRMSWAKQAADGLVDQLSSNGGVGGSNLHRLGLSSFGNSNWGVDLALGNSSAATVKAAINGLAGNGNTPLRQGMAAGAGDMAAHGQASRAGLAVKHVIIILSDGRPNPDNTTASGSRPTSQMIADFRAAADLVYSVAVGQGGAGLSQVDIPLMTSLAKPTPANFAQVVQASDLPSLFSGIFTEIACTPGIKVVKQASVPQVPADGGPVTYTFTVTNVGNVALTNVSVTDAPSCGTITRDSGDTNANNKLDLTETWVFSCTTTVTQATTDTATALGHDGNTEVSDQSSATVTVGDARPAIAVAKVADPTELPAGGGDVTYTFTVTNAGNVALSGVTVEDRIGSGSGCSPISGPSGDTNTNGKLDVDETWVYTCSAHVTANTSDTVTATGHHGQDAVTATADASVTVAEGPTPTATEPPPATPTPTEPPTPTATPKATATPGGGVEAETGTPHVTLPPTSTIDGSSTGSAGSALPLILLSLAGIALVVGFFVPMRRPRRRDRRG